MVISVRSLKKIFTVVQEISEPATRAIGIQGIINADLNRLKQDAVEYAIPIAVIDQEVVTTIIETENVVIKNSTV